MKDSLAKNIPASQPPTPDREERIAMLAFQIWEEQGRPEGKSDEHWYLACEMIDAEDTKDNGEVLPTWLNRTAETADKQSKIEAPAVVQDLNPKHQRRSAA